jgi:hypothetical protein
MDRHAIDGGTAVDIAAAGGPARSQRGLLVADADQPVGRASADHLVGHDEDLSA